MIRRILRSCTVLLLCSTAGFAADITLFAAASTTNAVSEVNALFTEKTGYTVVTSFASSGTLAKQIDSGAPANVYISANEKWMDYLENDGMLAESTRRDLLGNALVIAVPKGGAGPTVIEPGMDLSPWLGVNGRIALGDPAHVPAGQYAKTALSNLGMWDRVKNRIAALNDVRAALAHVGAGEAPLGIVYATDAAVVDAVDVTAVFPESSHPPIRYPVAGVRGMQNDAAAAYLGFLGSPEAEAVFAQYGFIVLK